jgi:putative ABC transport system permease protein
MTLRHLIIREIVHRRLAFLLALIAVVFAVGCLMGSMILLARFDLSTETLIAAKQADIEQQVRTMNDEFRKITKRMGFNVLILPQDQSLTDFYAENYADKTMPESYAETLANTPDIVTIRHLLPMVQAKIEWPEQKRKILLIGVKGEMPWAHRGNMDPLQDMVGPGKVAVGFELHQSLSLEQGDAITLMGQSFEVTTLHEGKGTIDDITLWIDLKQAQQLLGLEGRISAMTALECQCAWANLPKVRAEIQAILPDTQVIELAGKALARAEARNESAENAKLLLAREIESRNAMRAQRESLFSLIVPLVLGASAVVIGILAFLNVRERRIEIGILRSLGLHTKHILGVFLGKAFILGALGAVLGILIPLILYQGLSNVSSPEQAVSALVSGRTMVAVLLLTPIVTLLASWLPAMVAAQQDPAAILSEE